MLDVSDKATSRSTAKPPRRLAFYLITALLMIVALELFAVLVWLFSDDLFDHRSVALSTIESGKYQSGVAQIDPVLGWNSRPGEHQQPNCVGDEVTYTVQADGARGYTGYDPAKVEVILVGDSYTFGSEVDDDLAYPAVLSRLLEISVANLGVGGYGPVQAMLRLEQLAAQFPSAHTVIMGIMYENVHRMVNSYRAVLNEKSDVLAFKPYMMRGEVLPHPGAHIADSPEILRAHAEAAFDGDFWRKPRFSFPFIVSLGRSFNNDYFVLRKLQKRLRGTGMPEYAMTFASPGIQLNLFGLLHRFTAFANTRGLQPAVVFMPRNRHDVDSVGKLLAEQGDRLPEGLSVIDVGASEIDWQRYNLENLNDGNICHPSVYGYAGIARHVARKLGTFEQGAPRVHLHPSPVGLVFDGIAR